MRGIQILILIFCISIACGVVMQISPFTHSVVIKPMNLPFDPRKMPAPNPSLTGGFDIMGYMLWGYQYLIGWIVNSLSFVPTVLSLLGVPQPLAWAIQTVIFLAVGLYLIYFVTGRKVS